jgi:hypothetical protein
MNREEKRKMHKQLKSMSIDQFFSAMNVFHTKAYAAATRHYHQAIRELLTPEMMAAVIKRANEIRISEGMVTIDTNQTEVEIFYPEEVEGLQLGAPIPSKATEMQSQGSSDVRVLSKEEADAAWERFNKINGGDNAMGKMEHTKDEYLKLRAEGKTASQITKLWKMSTTNLGYWLGKWEMKGKAQEEAAIQEYLSRVAPVSEPAVPEGTQVVEVAKQVEPAAEQPSAEEPASPDAGAVTKVDPEPIILQDCLPHQAYISLAVPLIISNEPKLAKRDKAYESMSRLLSDGVDSTSLDYPILAADILEILQVVVSLVYDQTCSVVVKPGKALEAVQEFFSHHNQLHLKKMEELVDQDGWRKVTV